MPVDSSHKRSLAMAITYRVMATILLGVISYAATGDFFDTSLITISFTVLATIVYYINDRVWNKVDWGRKIVKRKNKN